MIQHHPLVQALSRLGAIIFLAIYLLDGLGMSLSTGRRIGHFFGEGLGGTFLSGPFFDTLMIGIGAFLGALSFLMFYVVIGTLLGSAAGVIIVKYVVEPGRHREQ